MIKKITNYFTIVALTLSLIAPLAASASGVVLSTSLMNLSDGDSTFVTQVNADSGDELIYSVKVDNQTDSAMSGLIAKTSLPQGLEYVSGFAKLWYLDANGQDAVMALNDSIASSNGVTLTAVPAHNYVYVTYKARVASSAPGTYRAINQVYDGNGTNVSSNNSVVNVSGIDTSVVSASEIKMVTALFNLTKSEQNYSTATTAERGDEIIYRVAIDNTSNAPFTNVHFRAVLPQGLEYVGGFAKLWYDTDNKVMPLNDAIASNGVVLRDIPAHTYVYVTYKAKVASSALAGDYRVANQTWNDNGVNVASNSALLTVSAEDQPEENRILFLDANAYNVTAAKSVGFSDNLSAQRGDIVKIKSEFANVGNTALGNVRITNALPSNMTYVPGSMKVVIDGATISTGDNILTSGAYFGDLSVGANGYMEFSVRVNANTPGNVTQLVYTANGNADSIAQVSSLVNISLTGEGGDQGEEEDEDLPDTGTPASTAALIILALFIAIASYIYVKETKMLQKAARFIKK